MIRPGYAIEYDMVQPTELDRWLETKKIAACFSPGRSTAPRATKRPACQGIMAGINAGLRVQGRSAAHHRPHAGLYGNPDRRPGQQGRR